MTALDDDEAPMLLARGGDHQVTMVSLVDRPDWQDVPRSFAPLLARLFDHASPTEPSVLRMRTFMLRPDDEALWDLLHRAGSDGYAHGTLSGADGRYVRNVALKELPSRSAAASPPAGAMIAAAALSAQMQASIESLTDMVEEAGRSIQDVLYQLRGQQQADILAAVETITAAHARFISLDRLDTGELELVAPLGQLLKSQHRQILQELQTAAATLEFHTFAEAKGSLHCDADRMSDLVALEMHLLRALTRWNELRVARLAGDGSLDSDDISTIRANLIDYLGSARRAIEAIASAESHPTERHWLEQLATHGLLGGHLRDRRILDSARANRARVQAAVASARQVPQLDTRITATLEWDRGRASTRMNPSPVRSERPPRSSAAQSISMSDAATQVGSSSDAAPVGHPLPSPRCSRSAP